MTRVLSLPWTLYLQSYDFGPFRTRVVVPTSEADTGESNVREMGTEGHEDFRLVGPY